MLFCSVLRNTGDLRKKDNEEHSEGEGGQEEQHCNLSKILFCFLFVRSTLHAMQQTHMHHCLALAQKGRGLVGINPLVGSVLVRENKIIAEGYYRGLGTCHAERELINNFDQEIQQEDTLYVNLEPCCHHGNTPPCTDIIIERGIKHVVIGMVDPDSRVAGKGIAALQKAGITVEGPVCRAECERLNRGYVSLRNNGRPYITLKKAQTIDGRVANADGSTLCITSDVQNTWSHTHLRKTHDAILVGVQTVMTDNPQLTIRHTGYDIPDTNQPICIILDPNVRIPKDANVVREGTVVVKDANESNNTKEERLREKGVEVIALPRSNNQFNLHALWNALSTIDSPISTILVEGGPTTWNAFKSAGCFDEEIILIQ